MGMWGDYIPVSVRRERVTREIKKLQKGASDRAS